MEFHHVIGYSDTVTQLLVHKFTGMNVKAVEHFKCDELTRAPCQLWLNFDAFDHFSTIKWLKKLFVDVATHPPVLHAKDSTLWTILGHDTGQKHYICAQEHDRGQTNDKQQTLGGSSSSRRSALCPPVSAVTAAAKCLLLVVCPQSYCCAQT